MDQDIRLTLVVQQTFEITMQADQFDTEAEALEYGYDMIEQTYPIDDQVVEERIEHVG